MFSAEEIVKKVFAVKSETDFNEAAIQVFQYQFLNNPIYREYLQFLNIIPEKISHYSEIPCLPIEFFKTQMVLCGRHTASDSCFTSSGTTGQATSKHYVKNTAIYEQSFRKVFEMFYGKPSNYCILALLPNYLERTGSSLVYMFDKLIEDSGHYLSGFYLNNISELIKTIEELKLRKQKTLLLGVTYALMDLADTGIQLSEDFIVMETGGMKGRRQELLKEELYLLLTKKFHVAEIHSEYGMTELLSQAYSKSKGLFECPPWMKIMVRDINDPFSYVRTGKNGGVNVIDLANVESCAFIETKDLGRKNKDGLFEIIGRFDNSDIRGCNLMIQ